jgi:large repetitive protein
MSDITVNVTNAGAASVAVSGGSNVNATVGNGGSVNVAVGTVSPGNATVVSGTLAINSVTTLAAGSQAYVKNDAGTAYAAKLDIGIPAGPATNVTVGSTTTLDSGNASVTGTTSGNNLTLAFAIPRGQAGQNGTSGVTPTITATASTLSAGSSATVTATPSNGGANVALAFGIPRGADGIGSGGGASLSDATPSALGTASAGTSSTASRSDHVHAVPTISYANLTNVPSTFSPSTHTHTAGQVTGLATVATSGSYADLTNVPSTFSPSTHTHSLASLTQSSATTGQVVAWNGTAWAAATPTSSDDLDGGDYVGVVASISVTQQPADVSIAINQGSTGSASFTVAASASTGVAVAYQWQLNQGSGWAAIDGATSATLSLTGLSGSDDVNLYRCFVSAFGLPSVASNAASLAVSVIVPNTPLITITSQPQAASIANTASTASFSIDASVSSGTLAFQWQKRDYGGTWVNFNGATSSTLSLTGLSYAADNGSYYRCRLTASGAATVTSQTVVLTINWVTAPQITIINGPATVNWPQLSALCSVTFDQRTYGTGNSGISFLWQAYTTSEFVIGGPGWVPVASVIGANRIYGGVAGGSLTVLGISAALTVRCTVTATNSYGTTTATTASITINPPRQVSQVSQV